MFIELKHIEFIALDQKRALVITIDINGLVENKIMAVPSGITASALIEATNYINSKVYGKTLSELKLNISKEFKFDLIGKFYQKGFDKSSGDWVLRMDIDYFFHEKDIPKIRRILNKYSTSPAIAFPQYQIFTPDRYQLKTKICLALNKKKFPQDMQKY